MITSENVIKNKLGLLELSQQLGDVSRACKIMGYSRDSFYRFKGSYICTLVNNSIIYTFDIGMDKDRLRGGSRNRV